MGLHKISLSFAFIILCNLLIFADDRSHTTPKHIYFLIHSNRINEAIEIYQEYFKQSQKHDMEFLQQLGLSLLDQGFNSRVPEEQLMTLFGAGISMNEKALYILKKGVSSQHPQLQLLALNFLAKTQNDEADEYLMQAMRSNFLIIRLEAAHQLALKRHTRAAHHIESLMGKVDEEIYILFPQLLAALNTPDASRMLRKMLAHPNELVRTEAILGAAKANRDDLLPKIRTLATHQFSTQLEACAIAFGKLKDEESVSRLETMSHSNYPSVKLAALKALYQLGRTEALSKIRDMALEGDLFAISELGDLPDTDKILLVLLQRGDNQVKLNAAIGLLKKQDPKCLPFLRDILLKDSRDIAFTKTQSKGKGFVCWRMVHSARQKFEDSPVDLEISLNFRETILEHTIDLPEDDFLKTAVMILDHQQNDLVPTTISLLESLQSPKAIAILKEYQQKVGAPLIRNYCNLALYRLREEGPYDENLRNWVSNQADENLIQLRPVVPWEMRDDQGAYEITAHETSRLLVESFEAFAKRQDDKGINSLLEAIKDGNQKNKYALAGLLLRASL